ncbi:GNAT family N-acetyltransferase [Bradyrhizobium prioriisuperbiae]|uniref:GNAT family N-acetyltransferase n=1 Tax=Bradyrhizobium prioriisuperbiae TaxID=2854389 RepID=UPI0028E673B2|nr:GNAT family N-acetyltransferase [Bradyrhizobium prioritasuperba]
MTTPPPDDITIDRLDELREADVAQLADVLIDCVDGGASVSFMQPLSPDKARAFWRGQTHDITDSKRIVLVARDAKGIIGTVQVICAQPDNQPHRADIAKMLVHRRARKRGIGAKLMRSAEDAARAAGKTLLVLDTVTGGDAERLYARLGWVFVGIVPDYALWPQGGLCSTSFYYRKLA